MNQKKIEREEDALQVYQKKFGAYLQAQRQLRKLSVEDVGAAIRVAVDKVQALEAGAFDKLPKMPFVAGIVKAYGRCVGCDVDELMHKMSEFTPVLRERTDLSGVGEPHDNMLVSVTRPRFYLTRKLVVTVIALAVFVAALWFGIDYFSDHVSGYIRDFKTESARPASGAPKLPTDPAVAPSDIEKSDVVDPALDMSGQAGVLTSAVAVASATLEIFSVVPNFIKIVHQHDADEGAWGAMRGVFVAPGQPYSVSTLETATTFLWALYPESIRVLIDSRDVAPAWERQYTRLKYRSETGTP